MAKNESVEKAVEKLGIGSYERHVFLCTGPTCCTLEEGTKAWEALKSELKNSGLGNVCQRTKVGCLRICCDGPAMLVYPEGTWYRGMSAERMPQLVRDHLQEGKPVEEWVFARNPLGKE